MKPHYKLMLDGSIQLARPTAKKLYEAFSAELSEQAKPFHRQAALKAVANNIHRLQAAGRCHDARAALDSIRNRSVMTKQAQLAEWHQLFMTLAELTAGAESMNQVAARAFAQGLINTPNPCDAAWAWSNQTDVFCSEVANAIWDPTKDPLWSPEETRGEYGRQ